MIGLATLAWVFVRRDFAIARSYRFPFLLQLVASAGILLVVFQVGHLVKPGAGHDPALRAGYFSYVLVGMSVLQVVHSALQSFTAKLRDEQVTGTFEALLTTPSSPAAIALSLAAYDLLQALTSACLLLGVGSLLGTRLAGNPLALLSTLVAVVGLCGLFAAVGIAVAAFTVVFKRGSTLAGLVSAALALFGGVYFPVAQLPQPVRWFADALPFTWGVTALRQSLLFGDVALTRLAGLVVGAAVALPVALLVFRRALNRARREGSLGHY